MKADTLVETKQKLTFLQKCIYQRMFYLKPFILKGKKKVQRTAGRYEVESSIRTGEIASRAINDQMHKYLECTKKNISNDLVNILYEKIMNYRDTRIQRLAYLRILKGIRYFLSVQK